jgi:hypothetical protein
LHQGTNVNYFIMKLTIVLVALFTAVLAAPAAVADAAADVTAIRPCICKAPICPLELIAV